MSANQIYSPEQKSYCNGVFNNLAYSGSLTIKGIQQGVALDGVLQVDASGLNAGVALPFPVKYTQTGRIVTLELPNDVVAGQRISIPAASQASGGGVINITGFGTRTVAGVPPPLNNGGEGQFRAYSTIIVSDGTVGASNLGNILGTAHFVPSNGPSTPAKLVISKDLTGAAFTKSSTNPTGLSYPQTLRYVCALPTDANY